VTGIIVSSETGEPLDAALVNLTLAGQEEPAFRALTQHTGRYLMVGVPAGRCTLEVELMGFGTVTRSVDVVAGESTIADFRLDPEPISLSEIVVTGVIGSTQRTKLPFDVVQVRVADLPVPSLNAAQSLQGKVAGVQVVQPSGIPGATPSILLRGVTSLDASGRSQDPLYIVDGIIVGTDLVDVSALDIQSIEVVKGAAAASLYGSRAANGVVHIRTKRGAEMGEARAQYTLRSEFGGSTLGRTPEIMVARAHRYAMTPDSTMFLNEDGTACNWLDCGLLALAGQTAKSGAANEWNTYQTNPWPGKTYDQVQRFFDNASFLQNQITVEGRSGRTNFHVSASQLNQGGIVRFLPGFRRTNFRVNLDQAVHEDLSVQASVFYSRSTQPQSNLERAALQGLRAVAPVVDLLAEDPEFPEDPVFLVGPNDAVNPLYDLKTIREERRRNRFLGSVTARYSPNDWFDIDGNFSFDQGNVREERFWPKGYRTTEPSWLNDGRLWVIRNSSEALNGSLTASGRFDLTDQVRNTTQIRYLVESQDYEDFWADGYEFAVADVPVMTNINQETLWSATGRETIRSDGYFLITNFDLSDRYVVDALIRNDGSSLFGEDERRQWYYRVGAAWRLGQEAFFHLPYVDDLKLRYSLGTAGGRPRFAAQYETFEVSQGRVQPNRLGNKDLKPEFSTEHEAGLDLSLLNYRSVLSLTYAQTTTEDQILRVPVANFTGFTTQWRNAGTLESKTWEATLDLRLIEKPDLSWSTKLLFDVTKTKIKDLYTPDFRYEGNIFLARKGEEVGTFYGFQAAMGCEHLPEDMSCDEFAVNDDGFLVWVGQGGSLDVPQWGADGPAIAGIAVKWGTPFAGFCVDRVTKEKTQYCPVGKSLPDYNLSLSTTLTWRGLTAYALFSRSAGFYLGSDYYQWGVPGMYDQLGVPVEQQKPVGYYNAWYTLAQGGGVRSTNMHDGTFTKLRELSLVYQIGPDFLAQIPGLRGIEALRLRLTGQNLFTWTDYPGYDPDVGWSDGQVASAAIDRWDHNSYPHMRTFTGSVEVVF